MLIKLKNTDYFRYLPLVWGLLGVCILWQFGSAMAGSVFLPGRVRKTLVQYKESAANEEQERSSSNEKPEMPKNPFAPPPKIGNLQCSAVLGNEALFNDRWYKVGDRVQGAEILEIQPAWVKLTWQGKEIISVPFNVPIQGTSKNNEPNNGAAPKNGESAARGSAESPSPASSGIELSAEQRRQLYERYQNASPEEREEMRRQMRERYGVELERD
jgi:hypothetical protein